MQIWKNLCPLKKYSTAFSSLEKEKEKEANLRIYDVGFSSKNPTGLQQGIVRWRTRWV